MNLETSFPREGGTPPPEDERPVVALRNPGLPGVAIAIIVGLLAVSLFLFLEARRHRPEPADAVTRADTEALAAPPPPLFVPPEAVPAPPPSPNLVPMVPRYPTVAPQPGWTRPSYVAPVPFPAPLPPPQSAVGSPPPPVFVPDASPAPAALSEPAIVFDAGGDGSPDQAVGSQPSAAGRSAPDGADAKAGSTPAAQLTRLRNPSTTVPTGTLIRATLETPIDTSRPGLARAIVSKDARGFDGRRVVIPRGSRLVGEYASDARAGQNRVLLTWTQLLRPDGSSIRLDSPATDAMGGAGVPGQLHTFFFQRFMNALLQTAINVGGSLAYSYDAPIIVGIPNAAVTNVVGQTAFAGQGPQPKITVRQGAVLNIFVARDLDFSNAPARAQSVADGR